MIDWKAVKDIVATVFSTEDCTIDPEGLERLESLLVNAGFRRLNAGRHRLAFLSPSGRNVVKVPINDFGVLDNGRESTKWGKRAEMWPLARCRLFCDGLLLVMEAVKIDPERSFSDLPEWAGWIDCGQVGLNRKGEFVTYDYAD
jgi:hypothetical protein